MLHCDRCNHDSSLLHLWQFNFSKAIHKSEKIIFIRSELTFKDRKVIIKFQVPKKFLTLGLNFESMIHCGGFGFFIHCIAALPDPYWIFSIPIVYMMIQWRIFLEAPLILSRLRKKSYLFILLSVGWGKCLIWQKDKEYFRWKVF